MELHGVECIELREGHVILPEERAAGLDEDLANLDRRHESVVPQEALYVGLHELFDGHREGVVQHFGRFAFGRAKQETEEGPGRRPRQFLEVGQTTGSLEIGEDAEI
jgi:hypothetical protein